MGPQTLVDLTIQTDDMISASAAQQVIGWLVGVVGSAGPPRIVVFFCSQTYIVYGETRFGFSHSAHFFLILAPFQGP